MKNEFFYWQYNYVRLKITKNFSFNSIINQFKNFKEQISSLDTCDFFHSYDYIKIYIIFIILVTVNKYINFEV